MATVKITRSQTNGLAPQGDVAPDEAAAIRASVAGSEQAPTTQQRSLVNWRQIANQLGDPYQVEQIPISKLKMMRRDPIIGFGLSFIKTPHIRARWYVNAVDNNGVNAQIAAHLDHDLRRVMSSIIFEWMNSLDFGFQAISKRFEFGTPSGTFVAPGPDGSPQQQPIWQQGNIQPIRWKPFVALPPELVEPNWGPDGEFNGINYDASQQGGQAPAGTNAQPSSNQQDKFDIDLYHSLWITNERDQNFGNIFGYPRLGYAYRAWWSYWFRWAIADRAFEKKADPSILIYHPEGEFLDPGSGQMVSYSDYALAMGNRMRSGGVITLPSTPYEGPNGPTNIREWEIDSTGEMTNFDPFDKSFDYLDIAKMRSLWIPEQSLVEGRGGTSSRNVAAELDSSLTESQAVLSVQISETINRWIVPQWLAVNYPEFLANNGTAEVIIQGFADEDVAFTQQVIQLVGQQPQGINKLITLIDFQKILDDAGVPLLDIKGQQEALQQVIQTQQAGSQPGFVQPIPGKTVGVVPSGDVAPSVPPPSDAPTPTGFSDPGSDPGFVYVQPREIIYLNTHGEDLEVGKTKIRIKRASDLGEGVVARFDPDANTVLLSESASEEDEKRYLSAIGEALVGTGS